MAKVYVITKGCYSDYRIEGVASTKSLAEKMAYLFSDRYEEADIEEYELDSFNGMSNGGEKTWHVNSDFRNNKLYVTGPYPSEGTETYVTAYDLYHLETDVVAETKEDAIKIANDRFAKKRAEMIGL